MLTKTKIALTAALLAVSASGAFAQGTGVPGERVAAPIYGPGAIGSWYEGGKDILASKLPAGQSRSAYEGLAQVHEGRNAYRGRAQAHYGRNAYEGRAAVEAPVYDAQPWGPVSSPSIYGGGF
jgi:hypothetical protein